MDLYKASTYIKNSSSTNGDEYPQTAIICCAISCFLSIVSSFIIFGSFIALPTIRNFTRKLIVCLTIADFLTATGYALGLLQIIDHENQTICVLQSFITTYSSLVSFFLTMATMFHLWITVISQSNFDTRSNLVYYNLISFSIPAIIVSVAFSDNALGATDKKGTGPWCWINSNHAHQVVWQVVTGKGWEIVCYIVAVTFYILLKYRLHIRHRHQRFQNIHTSLRDEDRNVLYVWFIFYSIRIWGTIRFVISAIDADNSHEHYMKALLYLQSFGDPLQAFCNCILFCFLDTTVRSRLCSCCKKTKSYEEIVNSVEIHSTIND